MDIKIIPSEDRRAIAALLRLTVFVQKVADKNVQLTVEQISSKSSLLDAMVKSGEIGIVGAMYDIETGKVKFYSDV